MNTDEKRDFVVHTTVPINGGPLLDSLPQAFITPLEHFFTRNHGDIPEVDATTYRLKVTGLVDETHEFSLDDLKAQFAHHTVAATLQCAGNRRTEMAAVAPLPGELPWGAEAIGTATWTGVALADVLAAVGIDPSAQHVEFIGLDQVERLNTTFGFGGSIPLDQALKPTTLLAFAMNGAPLTPLHGAPLRVIVPGYVGARCVKWLETINLQQTPSTNYFQAHAYQLFPPYINADNVDWSAGEHLGPMNVNSVICCPQAGAQIEGHTVTVRGYAVTGGDAHVVSVELSLDDGLTWQPATLHSPAQPGVWQLWSATVELPQGRSMLVVRASDSEGATQPADPAAIWNFKGYMNNAWHRVPVTCLHELAQVR